MLRVFLTFCRFLAAPTLKNWRTHAKACKARLPVGTFKTRKRKLAHRAVPVMAIPKENILRGGVQMDNAKTAKPESKS